VGRVTEPGTDLAQGRAGTAAGWLTAWCPGIAFADEH
jgi:hypothetical protein